MWYCVAIRPGGAGQWMFTAPVFDSAEEAGRYMDALPIRFKRIVQVGRRRNGPSCEPHPDLDRNRLAFARYLVQTGRLAA